MAEYVNTETVKNSEVLSSNDTVNKCLRLNVIKIGSYVLFLDKEVNSGQVMADVVSNDLRFNLVDPAINVVAALFIQYVTVCIKQLLSLCSCCLLQLFPLPCQLINPRLDVLYSMQQSFNICYFC